MRLYDQDSPRRGNFRNWIIPPPQWQVPVIILVGIIAGLGISIMYIANAGSYLSDDPKACINCHIMTPEYSTWEHSSHRGRANCNDCHVPHNNIVRKYFFKAQDGLRHATIFTLRAEPQVIRIGEAGKTVVQENCLRCHINQVNPVSATNVNGKNYKLGEGMLCWGCHRETPHGRMHSLTSTPNAIVPGLSPVIPQWMKKDESNKGVKK